MSRRDFDDDAINDAIETLYNAVADDDIWPTALDSIASLSGGSGIIVYGVGDDVTKAMPSGSYATSSISDIGRIYIDEWIDRAPLNLYMKRNPIFDRACWDGEVLDVETIKQHEFYNDYARQYGLKHGVIRARRSGHVIVTPYSEKAGPPDGNRIKVFDLLSGHALKALAMRERLGTAESAFAGASELLASRDCAVVLLDGQGRVTEVNDAARRLAGDGFLLRQRRFLASQPRQQHDVERLVARSLKSSVAHEASEPIALKRPSGRLPLLVNAAPLRASVTRDHFLAGSRGVVMTIIDPDPRAPRYHARAMTLLGLTDAESKVAAIVATGASPDMAAHELGISVGTVRIHLSRIYSKLGISRQGELVAIAGRLTGLTNES